VARLISCGALPARRGEVNISRSPDAATFTSPWRGPPGEGKAISPSRRFSASELCHATARKPSRCREAERRKAQTARAASIGCGARHAVRCCHLTALRARAPSGAPPRTRFGELTPPLSSSRASWATFTFEETTLPQTERLGVIGCHPHLPLSQSSELLAGRSLLPAGRCPEPPGSGVTSPARGHRTCFRHSAVTGDALRRSKLAACNYSGDDCQGVVTCIVTTCHSPRKRGIQ